MLTLNFDLALYHSAPGPTALFEFLGELFELCSAEGQATDHRYRLSAPALGSSTDTNSGRLAR